MSSGRPAPPPRPVRPRPPLPAEGATPQQLCAARLVELMPQWMREIRTEMRTGASPTLPSVPAFRVLIFARYHPGASVSELAAHHGITLPTASVSVDRLVAQGLLESRDVPGDRRRRALHLTRAGRRLVDTAMLHTTDVFAARLAALDAGELAAVMQALDTLSRVLLPARDDGDADTGAVASDPGAEPPASLSRAHP